LKNSTPSDYVYDGVPQFNIYRKDPDYFWFNYKYNLLTWNLLTGYTIKPKKILLELKPAIALINGFKADDPDILKQYEISEEYPSLLLRK
jgi:hypothetical protein